MNSSAVTAQQEHAREIHDKAQRSGKPITWNEAMELASDQMGMYSESAKQGVGELSSSIYFFMAVNGDQIDMNEAVKRAKEALR